MADTRRDTPTTGPASATAGWPDGTGAKPVITATTRFITGRNGYGDGYGYGDGDGDGYGYGYGDGYGDGDGYGLL